MTRVLLVAAANVSRDAVANALGRFPAGTVVDLAVPRNRPQDVKGLKLHHVRVMRRPASGLRSSLPKGAVSPRVWLRTGRAVASRVVSRRGSLPLKAWYAARWDPWVARATREADVLVALDRYAVYPVWQLARRNRRAAAVYGLDAAVRAAQQAASSATASANAR